MTDNKPAQAIFGFINDDVAIQVAGSQSILDVAEKLREKLARTTDETEVAEFTDVILKLVRVANDLTANAISTATIASAMVMRLLCGERSID